MIRRLLIVIALLFCLANFAHADEVDDIIHSQMQKQHIPGLSLAVVREGKIIKAASYGLANVELNARVSNDTVFEIASNSKQFTAGGIILLVQDGKLKLDDRMTQYLAGFPNSFNGITIRHLLTHTSGIKDYIEEFRLERSVNHTDQEIIKAVGDTGLNFSPGEDARYSTTGYLLLGLIIEKVTGKPYGEFLKERIFEPLGMNRTRVISLAEIIPNRATGYTLENGTLRNGRFVGYPLRASADIGLMTTALDQVKWDAAFNSEKIFRKSTLELILTPAKLNNDSLAYNAWNGLLGFGWFIDNYRGHVEINHGGTFITGFHANISRFINDQLTIIILTNQVESNPSMIGYTIAGIYNPALRPPHMLEEKTDANPQRSQMLKQFLSDVANGADTSPRMTQGLRLRLTADNKSEVAAILKDLKSFVPISCENIEQRGVVRIGARVSNLCDYKVITGQKTHYVTFYLTAQDQVADMWIYAYDK